MDRLAAEGNPSAHAFPRPMLNDPSDDFSFSGLKTSVRYFLRDHPETLRERSSVCDLCASIQAAIVEVLVTKVGRAARRAGVGCVTASGGVTRNRGLRKGLAELCREEGWELRLAARDYCTDNAAMIAVLAERKWTRGGIGHSLREDIKPGWAMD